jgi:hypothetical protein
MDAGVVYIQSVGDDGKEFMFPLELDTAAKACAACGGQRAMVWLYLLQQLPIQGNPVEVGNRGLKRLGVSRRTKYRALRLLEAGGHVSISSQPGKAPRATEHTGVLEGGPENKAGGELHRLLAQIWRSGGGLCWLEGGDKRRRRWGGRRPCYWWPDARILNDRRGCAEAFGVYGADAFLQCHHKPGGVREIEAIDLASSVCRHGHGSPKLLHQGRRRRHVNFDKCGSARRPKDMHQAMAVKREINRDHLSWCQIPRWTGKGPHPSACLGNADAKAHIAYAIAIGG